MATAPSTLARSAETIRSHSARMPDLFPAGTYDPPSEALSAIDDRRDAFDDLARRLIDRADALATLSDSPDRDLLADWYRNTGKVCSACHKDFRAKR